MAERFGLLLELLFQLVDLVEQAVLAMLSPLTIVEEP